MQSVIIAFILARLREVSTYAGLSALLAVFGIPADVGPLVKEVGEGVAAAIGILAIVWPDKGNRPVAK